MFCLNFFVYFMEDIVQKVDLPKDFCYMILNGDNGACWCKCTAIISSQDR